MQNEDEIVIEACVQAILKLIEQGKVSYDEETSSCMYRLDSTASCPIRCAVGHMIKDEYYDSTLENQASCRIDVSNVVAKSLGIPFLSEKSCAILSCLQMAHDDIKRPGEEFEQVLLHNIKECCGDSGDEIFNRLAEHGVYIEEYAEML